MHCITLLFWFLYNHVMSLAEGMPRGVAARGIRLCVCIPAVTAQTAQRLQCHVLLDFDLWISKLKLKTAS